MAEDATESRRKLGELLETLRKRNRLVQTAAAGLLGFGQSTLAKIEKGSNGVSGPVLERMLEVYGADEAEIRDARKLAAWAKVGRVWDALAPSHEFRRLMDSESEAAEILAAHSARIPGPLQSEGYVVQQHQGWSGEELAMLLERRRARSRVLQVSGPLRYRVVLCESSLWRLPGGFSWNKQLDLVEHLLTLCDSSERLELQVLRFIDDIAFVDTDVSLLRFGADKKDFVYIEYPGGGYAASDTSKTFKACLESWHECHRAAAGAEDTRKFLENLKERATGEISKHPGECVRPPSVG